MSNIDYVRPENVPVHSPRAAAPASACIGAVPRTQPTPSAATHDALWPRGQLVYHDLISPWLPD
eukprot:4620019-Pleurochrysis_carterae.AAC.1